MDKITYKKYMGDDLYSWAVFVNGRPVITGLNRRMAKYYADDMKRQQKQKQEAR